MGVRLRMLVAGIGIVMAWGSVALAEVKIAKVFGDGLVLQRGMEDPVWGTAAVGEKVSVSFGGVTKETVAADGKWRVVLDKMEADAEGREMRVVGTNVVVLKDVLVGEVWLCGGQSNMEYPLNRARMKGTSAPPKEVKDISDEEFKTAKDEGLRIFRVEKRLDEELPTDGWHVATGESLEKFSAIGYFFGKGLRADLKGPVGLMESVWGGSRIELWTSADAYEGSGWATTRPGTMDGSPVGKYYSKMVGPMAGYGVRGMIWYQGESNLIDTNNLNYVEKFATLARTWRAAWGEGAFPIGTVQIAPLAYTRRKDPVAHTTETLPELWGMQVEATRTVKNVGLVETADVADAPTNIHPWNKWDVGDRLAKWARGAVYGEKGVEWSGPVMESVKVDGPEAMVTFSHGKGMKGVEGREISGFEVKTNDGKWVRAKAETSGDGSVTATAMGVAEVQGVRYSWRETAEVGLVNGVGLPAVGFKWEK